MMSLVSIGLLGLLGLKVFWNLTLPYTLPEEEDESDGKSGGVSLMLSVEWICGLLLVGSSALSEGSSWLDDPAFAALVSVCLIVASYLHFVLASLLMGTIRRRRGKGARPEQ